jgi:hypothetical protein
LRSHFFFTHQFANVLASASVLRCVSTAVGSPRRLVARAQGLVQVLASARGQPRQRQVSIEQRPEPIHRRLDAARLVSLVVEQIPRVQILCDDNKLA